MNSQKIKRQQRERRGRRVRVKIFGDENRPRIAVSRSLKHIGAQLIDDKSGRTLLSVSDREINEGKTKTDKASAVGKLLAEKAKAKKISKAVFDKGAYKYHGRIKSLADSARENGLEI